MVQRAVGHRFRYSGPVDRANPGQWPLAARLCRGEARGNPSPEDTERPLVVKDGGGSDFNWVLSLPRRLWRRTEFRTWPSRSRA